MIDAKPLCPMCHQPVMVMVMVPDDVELPIVVTYCTSLQCGYAGLHSPEPLSEDTINEAILAVGEAKYGSLNRSALDFLERVFGEMVDSLDSPFDDFIDTLFSGDESSPEDSYPDIPF